MTHTTIKNLTEQQIHSLRADAGEHGDFAMVAICDLALTGEFDCDDWTTLSREEVGRIQGMSREEAYAEIVRVERDGEDAAVE